MLGVLQRSKDPLSALTIAKQVGGKSASDVNRTLCQLEQEGKICKTTTLGIIPPLWKIAGTIPSDDPPPMTDDRLQQVANGIIPPQYSHQAVICGVLVQQVLYVKNETEEGEIKFRVAFRPTNYTPTVIPVNETVGGPQLVPPHSIQESIANPSTTPPPQEIQPIQASESDHESRPIQIEVDDRFQQPTDPVTPPHPINFAERGKEMEKDEKSKTKNFMPFSFKNPLKNSASPFLTS